MDLIGSSKKKAIKQYELFIKALNLVSNTTISPYCHLQWKTEDQLYMDKVSTEVIPKTRDPEWKKSLTIDWDGETLDTWNIQVLSGTELIGSVECSSRTLLSRHPYIAYLVKNNQNQTTGTVVIHSEEVRDIDKKLTLVLAGHDIEKKDIFGKSDPYLIFYRLLEDGNWWECHRTEKIMGTTEPYWRPIETNVHNLCNGDVDRAIKIECYDWDRIGKDEYIASVNITLTDLCVNGSTLELINSDKIGRDDYTNSGKIEVISALSEKNYTFHEYLMMGTMINIMVGIDFTFSNGDHTLLSSLHYANTAIKNEYQRAIENLQEVMEKNIENSTYEAYGFGGIPDWVESKQVNHCFALNKNEENPSVNNFTDIVQKYLEALPNIKLSGPSYFHTILQKAIDKAKPVKDGKLYTILILVTDGDVDDLPQVVELLQEASKYPISVIVVGVGEGDFSNMDSLDSDTGLLRSNKQQDETIRDLVQFVPYRQLMSTPQLLSDKILEELPVQFETYMRNAGIKPEFTPESLLKSLTLKHLKNLGGPFLG